MIKSLVFIIGSIYLGGATYAVRFEESIFPDPSYWIVFDIVALIVWYFMFFRQKDDVESWEKGKFAYYNLSYAIAIPIICVCVVLNQIGFTIYFYKINGYAGIAILMELAFQTFFD